jgi:hypothetical protein
MVSQLAQARTEIVPTVGNANFIRRDEQRALRYLAKDRQPGGVLTGLYLGQVVPAETGRRTYIGDCLWSEPDCGARAELVERLFHGGLSPKATRDIVRQIGAHFVLAACSTRPDLDEALAPIADSERRFGCARVYTLSSRARSD